MPDHLIIINSPHCIYVFTFYHVLCMKYTDLSCSVIYGLPWSPILCPDHLYPDRSCTIMYGKHWSVITLKLAVWERRGCFWQRRLIIRYLKPICEISVLYSAVLIPSLLRENITKSPKWSQITKTRATDIQACGTQAGWAMSTTCGAPTHARKAMSSITHNVWCPHAG